MASDRLMKYASLIVLVLQNTALVLTLRYSRKAPEGETKLYIVSTAVVMTEITKFIICTSALFYLNRFNMTKTLSTLKEEIIDKPVATLKLSVPAILYTIQNNLLFVALSNLDAATFQVTYQLKILTTALFSVLMLGKKLSSLKWLSLVILMFAVALVQWPSSSSKENTLNSTTGSIPSSIIGVGSILLACISSGFSGVYIEKMLKQSTTSMWIRNIQLSLMSFAVGLFGVFLNDRGAVSTLGFFHGYSTTVAAVIALQAAGGLIVAAVMKFADNILKGFATSLSIVLSSLVSYFILSDFTPSWFFVTGAFLVLVSTFMYSKAPITTMLPTHKQPKTLEK